MNAEEAKAPNVEKNWQSIEIFLFSNGQYNTPPRKYLLRVDELNLWDATLNQLAQSHYGLQYPIINLYTTDGNLVKGPLDLRDGHAYVAVVPPDTYVDAGYQKYLIRASRSWEKRQARKKPQECVPGDPCCLCPERERSCCDPETCCLCPEREDEDSIEQLLPAPVHPDLRSAGGHYMSSAPANPDATDYYEPVSDKSGRMIYENRTNPNKYGTTPGEHAARSVEDETRQISIDQQPDRDRRAEYDVRHDYETRPSVNGAKLGENAARPSLNEGRSGENDGRPAEFGAKQVDYETRPSVNGTKPGERAARPSINEGRPSEIDARPVKYETRRDEYETSASVNESKPNEYAARPNMNGGTPGKFQAMPAEFGARQIEYEKRPRVNGAKPGEYASRPSINGGRQGEFGARPDEYETRRDEYETRASVNGAKPDEYANRPSINGGRRAEFQDKPAEFGAKQVEHETRPSVNGGKPGEYTARTSINRGKPGEFEARPAEFGAKPGENAARLSMNGGRPGEYGVRPGDESKPNVNETRPGEYAARKVEYGARTNGSSTIESKPVEFGAQPAEYATRLSEYGVMLSENTARASLNGSRQGDIKTKPGSKTGEYSIRPDGYRARQDEYGTKPNATGAGLGEYGARQLEYRSNLNEVRPGEFGAKPVENETKASANGAKSEEYGTRLEEFENRPSVNEVRPGEYHTKRSTNGSKPEEYGVRLDEYDTRPSLNASKPGGFGAKPAEYGVRLAEYEIKPTINGTKHTEPESEYIPIPSEIEMTIIDAKSDEYGNRRDENKTSPDGVGAKRASYETKPKVNGLKPGEYETKPSVNETKPGEVLATPVEYATRSAERENIPDAYVPSPAKNGTWSGEYGDRTTSHKARPGHSGPWPGKIEPIKEAYETALREKEKQIKEGEERPDKDTADYDTSIKYEKEIDPKDRSRGNGKRDGERRVSGSEKHIREHDTVSGVGESKARKIENARRLSGHKGAEIEQGVRTAEPTRGFEHGGRVSAQKTKEPLPVGRTSGPAVRLSLQKNRQTDNSARSAGRESRMGDHEARAGDIGLQISGHEAGLNNTGSRESELGARAAVSAVRATPRDKMSSRPKTPNLGQPKVGKPGTKIDEASARPDDSENKHKVDTSGARQSRVEGTGTSEALHIFDAQQNARKNTLSAGRPSIDKKRLSIGQISLLRKPFPNSSIPRKSEPIKSNKDNLPKKINDKVSPVPVPASKNTGKSKLQPQRNAPPATPPSSSISTTNIANLTTDKDPLDKVVDEKEINAVSTHSFKDPESETKSMMMDSVKHAVGAIDSLQAETQTELIYIEKSMANPSVNVQTDTEELEKQGKEVSTSKEKVNSCTCSLCKPNHNSAPDPDENTLSMFNKGGVVNIKLDIEVRNIVKSVYSCHKNCGRSRSLTNVQRTEKESEISIGHDVVVNRTSLQNLFNKQNFGGFGFESSPQVMVVQCAGCGKQNTPPQCDPPPRCDTNKKYFVLLNSVLEDMEDGCNFNPPCRPCDQRQAKRQSSSIPLKQAFSETTLDTITTVTVSGVPLQRREVGKCAPTTSCQTEETQNESMTTKRKVSISQDSVTKCDLHKKSSTSVSAATQPVSLVPKQSCLKMCSQKCEYEDSQICSELCRVIHRPTCENFRSVCSHVRPPTCEKVVLDGSQVPQPTCEKVQPDGSQIPPPTCEKVQLDGSQVPPLTGEKIQPDCSQISRPICEKVRPDCSQIPSTKCEKVESDGPLVYPQTCEKRRSECSHVHPPPGEKVRPECSQVSPSSCEKVQLDCSQTPSTKCKKVRPVCSQEAEPTCEKVRSVCSQVSLQTCSQVQTKGCQSLGPQVQSEGRMPVTPTCPACCSQPLTPCLQIQACLPQPAICNAETQTRWASILLQARLHSDGRYSFHLPPLHLLKSSNCHSCCQ